MHSKIKGEKLHILIMPSWYKSPDTPVLGTFFEEQARALQKEGFKVGIIYPEYSPPGELLSKENKEFVDFYMDKGIPTFQIRASAGIPKLRRLSYRYFSKSVDRVFSEYVANFGRPDIIHAHSVFHAGIAGFHIAKTNKIPFVITEHLTAYLMGYINNKVDIEMAREIFQFSDASIIVSHNFSKDLEKQLELPHRTFNIIHNLVNDLFFESYTPKTYTPGEQFDFFTNSFLMPRKNIALIVSAIKILKERNYNVTLTIGGDGPEEPNLRQQSIDLGIQDIVFLKGKLFRQEVKEELDKCHAFVLASQYETFGVVLIESLACGRPVVTTNSGGPLDFIHKKQGIIVEQHEAEALADGMEQLINDYNSYDQPALIKYCRDNFNEHKIAGEIISLYQKVLDQRSSPKKAVAIPGRLNSIAQKQILMTIDYELFLGNRSGFVDNCMILPTNQLLSLLKKYNIKAVFFIDTVYLLRLKEAAEKFQACADDLQKVMEQILDLVRAGHYVFPHLHPHWIDASYSPENNQWKLNNTEKYLFKNISDTDRSLIFDGSIELLHSIIQPHFPGYKVIGYRAGGWSIQPFENFKPFFKKHHIQHEFTVMRGFYQFTDAQYFDFSFAPEKNIYRFNDDVCVDDPNGEFYQYNISSIKIPLHISLMNRVWMKLHTKISSDHSFNKGEGQPSRIIRNIKPVAPGGKNLSDTRWERIAVELLTSLKLPVYLKYVEQNNYMQFISHPKMISEYNLVEFDKFLKIVFEKYQVETDFLKMRPDL